LPPLFRRVGKLTAATEKLQLSQTSLIIYRNASLLKLWGEKVQSSPKVLHMYGLMSSYPLRQLKALRRWILKNTASTIEAIGDGWWNGIVAARFTPDTLRMALYRLNKRMHISDSSHIKAGCELDCNEIWIGRDCFINRSVRFFGSAKVSIGDDCAIGCETMFVTISHDSSHFDRRAGDAEDKSISIGNGVWIATRVTLLPGAVVENGCILAAGSVVLGRCHANGLYGGVPAKRIKELPTARSFYDKQLRPAEAGKQD
jgi:maltose O-acetyltransferase